MRKMLSFSQPFSSRSRCRFSTPLTPRMRRSQISRILNWLRAVPLTALRAGRATSSPIPSFLGGRGGLEEVCLRHGLGEVLHQWREARLWHIRDQVVEHAALAE